MSRSTSSRNAPTSSGSTSAGSTIPRDAARRDLASLRALPFQVVELSPLPVLELAADFEITAYDAGYAALAQHLDVPFVTADERLVRKLAKSDCKIVWLGNLEKLSL